MRRYFYILLFLFISIKTYADEENFDDYDLYVDVYNYSELDPYEKRNRKIYNFNSKLDDYFFRPSALIYEKLTNQWVRTRVTSFTSNLAEPLSFVAYISMINFKEGSRSFCRFFINSIFGFFGLFDVASHSKKLHPEQASFNDVLRHYGVKQGKYIVWPIFGPKTTRQSFGGMLNMGLDPVTIRLKKRQNFLINSLKILSVRQKMLGNVDLIVKNSIDEYSLVRSMYFQNNP